MEKEKGKGKRKRKRKGGEREREKGEGGGGICAAIAAPGQPRAASGMRVRSGASRGSRVNREKGRGLEIRLLEQEKIPRKRVRGLGGF